MRIWWLLAALVVAVALVAGWLPVVVRMRFRLSGTRLDARFELSALGGLLRRRFELPRVTRRSLRPSAIRGDGRGERSGSGRARGPGGRTRAAGRRPRHWLRWFGSFPQAMVERLAGRVQVRRLRLRGSLGTGDAAGTALAFGGVWAALGGLLGTSHVYVRYACRPDVRLQPDFRRRRLALVADCILAARSTDIIIAVGLALLSGQLRVRGRGLANPRLNRSRG